MNEWTIMVYMAGDNELSEDMTKRLIEMRTIFDQDARHIRTKRIGLLAYLDNDNPMIFTQKYNFSKGITGVPVKPSQRGSNSADALTLEEFVSWCIKDENAVAQKYALFISGHGDGFQQSSFLRDASSSASMTVNNLKAGLIKINSEILNIPKLDLICFDSCVMNTIEIAAEFDQVAEMMVGSQGYLPTTGWSYKRIVDGLIDLDQQPSITKQEIAAVVVEAAIENNRQLSELTKRSLDMGIYDLSENKIGRVLEAVNRLAEILEKGIASQLSRELDFLIKRPVKKVLLNAHWKSQTYLFDQSVDIIDFCENLEVECLGLMFQFGTLVGYSGVHLIEVTLDADGEVADVNPAADISEENAAKFADVLSVLSMMREIADTCRELRDATDECILKSCISGPDFQFGRGMSMLLPWSKATLALIKPKLESYAFNNSKWVKFLENYLEETLRLSEPVMKKNNLSKLRAKFLLNRTLVTSVLVDPPPAAQLVTNSQYKDYFMRTKNFPLDDVTSCSK